MSIVIAGYYGFGNAGDELILHSMINRIRNENPAEEIIVLSKRPKETQDMFGVQAVDRWRPSQWISPLAHASRFILGGGGLLQESTGPWNHFYYLSLILIAKLCGCRTEIAAIGVDPIQSPLNRFWTRFVLNHWVDELSVRDQASQEALKRAGVWIVPDIRPDPVLGLKVERHCRPSGRIAFAISPSKNNAQWNRGVAELCDLLTKRLDVSIDFLIFFPQQDEKCAREIVEHAAFAPHVRLWQNPLDLVSWMPRYDVVVATRFHALALAALSKVPFMGWGNQSKVAALCREFGKPYVNTEKIWDVTDQVNRVTSLYESRNKSVILTSRTD